jgi:hypothetical protein
VAGGFKKSVTLLEGNYGMKKALVVTLTFVFLFVGLGILSSTASAQEDFNYKKGDAIYACTCGEKCPCDTLARKAGKCTCGVDLVKANITDVQKGIATVSFEDGHSEAFKLTKYKCACGKDCGCSTMSQNAGKCVCGKEMKAAKQ